MNKPLHWNTLTESAAWLSEKLKRPISERVLLNMVIDKINHHIFCDYKIISVLIPPDVDLALVHYEDLPRYSVLQHLPPDDEPDDGEDIDYEKVLSEPVIEPKQRFYEPQIGGWPIDDVEKYNALKNDFFTTQFGALPDGLIYDAMLKSPKIGYISDDDVRALFFYGETIISEINRGSIYERPPELILIVPIGRTQKITLNGCGIFGDDLLTLSGQMVAADDVSSEADACSTIATEQEASADDQPKDMTQWQARAEIRAPELWQEIQDNGTEPTKALLTIELSKDLRNEGYTGQRSKLTNDNVERHFVSKWQPPNKGNKGTKTGT